MSEKISVVDLANSQGDSITSHPFPVNDLFDGYLSVNTFCYTVGTANINYWDGILPSPVILGTPKYTTSKSGDAISMSFSITGSFYLPAVTVKAGSFSLGCTRNGGLHSPLIYKIRYLGNSVAPGPTELVKFEFTITDTVVLAINDPETGNVFATVFLANEDPKTSRGTVTTIIKTS